MMVFKALRHLLPKGLAFRLFPGTKIEAFTKAVSDTADSAVVEVDNTFLQVLPDHTTAIDEWGQQFAIDGINTLSLADARARIKAQWRAVGGQDPAYLQDVLRTAGFDVYVHEWWEPSSVPAVGDHACATPRDPNSVLRPSYVGVPSAPQCGEAWVQCGEPLAQCTDIGTVLVQGYPLVNKILTTKKVYSALCSETWVQCGEPLAQCGQFSTIQDSFVNYTVPVDPSKWAYFLYIGGPNFGDVATVPADRRNDFENLAIAYRPAHLWLGMIVKYQ